MQPVFVLSGLKLAHETSCYAKNEYHTLCSVSEVSRERCARYPVAFIYPGFEALAQLSEAPFVAQRDFG